MSFTRHEPFEAGEDHGNFAWRFPVCGRFLPFIGQEFEVAEFAPYKHNGRQDGSWINKTGNDQTVFRCVQVDGPRVTAQLVRARYNSFMGSYYRFNTNVVRLTPVNFKCCSIFQCCSVALCRDHTPCTLNPFVEDTTRLTTKVEEQRREIERLRSQLGHANSRLASQDSRIRTLVDRAQRAAAALDGHSY
jgi:hypothetical protein